MKLAKLKMHLTRCHSEKKESNTDYFEQKKKPRRIAEELILPCTKEEMVLSVLDEDATRKISDISVSNNTIRRSIAHSFTDLRSESVEEMMECPLFSIQLDETTDVSLIAQLLTHLSWSRDCLGSLVRVYTCKRRIQRWPIVLWLCALDCAGVAAYVICTCKNQNWNAGKSHRRTLFLMECGRMRSLVREGLDLIQWVRRFEGHTTDTGLRRK
ncbi:SCAN domain-containing protein 3 [Trichinella papuae]|uniref:SCAN domain-containing protein 3 n=1 Tax=Trichinella papuae TaxID=268474 RepID=A0A0V1MRA6_9BILA|nr:SCAN domain-containing protein 3 [Trichinella papuae]